MVDDPRLSSDEDGDQVDATVATIRGNESFNSLATNWSRWDSSDAGICEKHVSGRRNFPWNAPRQAVNSLCRRYENNFSIDTMDNGLSSQKIFASNPMLGKARSLSPGPTKSKLRSCPPRLPRQAPRCGCCKPPKAPVRTVSESKSDSAPICGCGADRPPRRLSQRRTNSTPATT